MPRGRIGRQCSGGSGRATVSRRVAVSVEMFSRPYPVYPIAHQGHDRPL